MKTSTTMRRNKTLKTVLALSLMATVLTSCSSDDDTPEIVNETETPAEDITEEVAEESDEHQFFFSLTGSLAEVAYTDEDADGNPIGLEFELTTGDTGSGTITITLRHEPTKPNDGNLTEAGGETDIAQTFTVVVE